MEKRPCTTDRLIGTALLSPVLLAIAFSFFRLITESSDVPDDDDYGAAAAFLDERGLSRDDAIVILPPWSLRPLVALGARTDRVVGGDGPWWALTQGRYARLFILQEPDAAPWREGAPLSTSTHSFGAVHVIEQPSTASPFDFKARFDEAAVGVDDEVCTKGRSRGLQCGNQRVAREWALVSENGREIIWAPPPPAGKHLHIDFDDVPLGAALVVAAGHTRDGAEQARASVRLQVKVDDDVIATLVRQPSFFVEPSRAWLRQTFVAPLDPQGQGFRVERIDTARFAGTHHRVSFVIDADDDKGQAFGFDAFVPGAP